MIIAVTGFIGFGLYTMEIEDHYGDLQELYYESENGDVIINKTTSEIGIVEKTWTRINIRTVDKDSSDLYSFIYRNGVESKAEIYRPINGKIRLNELTYTELEKRINYSELKLIKRN